MSSDDSAERTGGTEARGRSESWISRIKLALGLKPAASIRNDLEDALEEQDAGDDDDFSTEERRILRNLLTARGKRVQDVMVPRGAIIGISDEARFEDLRVLFASAGHSRVPVYGETLDDPKGMIHIRDMFAKMQSIEAGTAIGKAALVRPLLFAPGSMPALDLLLDMQAKRIHMALVIDEYGATDGLVSLEDLIEIIVGDIEDEHDIVEDPNIEPLADGAYAIDARASLERVSALMGVEFAAPSEEHDIETVGGYVTAFLGRVPAKGETMEGPNGLMFTVVDGDPRRLRRIQIAPPPTHAIINEP